MVEGIVFTDKRFDTNNENNQLDLTENTIILCNNYNLMDSLADEIINTINGKAEYNDYWCEDDDVGKAKYEMCFGLQRTINVGTQKIILCLEPAMIYRAKKIEDIWFCDCIGEGDSYKESIYPMSVFIGSHDVFNEGLDKVYKMIVFGRYGCYDGRTWTKLGDD
jgi:hypothetical protein